MGEVQEPANIAIAKLILDVVEKELIENRSRLVSAESRVKQLQDEERLLKEERMKLLRELQKLEIEECREGPSIFADGIFIGRSLKGKVFDD